MDTLLVALGATLRHRRQKLKLRQADIAEATGQTEQYISQIERGKANPSFLVLYAICCELEIRFDTVLAESGIPMPPLTELDVERKELILRINKLGERDMALVSGIIDVVESTGETL